MFQYDWDPPSLGIHVSPNLQEKHGCLGLPLKNQDLTNPTRNPVYIYIYTYIYIYMKSDVYGKIMEVEM